MKFRLGEVALYVGRYVTEDFPFGAEVEVVRVGPYGDGDIILDGSGRPHRLVRGCDYAILRNDLWKVCRESELRKRYQPGSDIARDIMRDVSVESPDEVTA